MKYIISTKITIEQLEYIGIDRDIRGMDAIFVKEFPDEYVVIKVKPPKHIAEFLNDDEEYYEEYDIPKHWLTFKND